MCAMKLRIFVLSLLSAVALFTSCDELSSLSPSTSILNKTEYTIPSDGGMVSLKFVPKEAWNAKVDQKFVTLSATSGEASETEFELVATVAKNEADTPRTAILSLNVGSAAVDVKLIQEAAQGQPDLPTPPDPTPPDPEDPENPTGTTEDVTSGGNINTK